MKTLVTGSPIKPVFNWQLKIPQSKQEEESNCTSINSACFAQWEARYSVLLPNLTATKIEPDLSSSTRNQSGYTVEAVQGKKQNILKNLKV